MGRVGQLLAIQSIITNVSVYGTACRMDIFSPTDYAVFGTGIAVRSFVA